MLFGKRNKKPDERVLELKARVDALRQVDEARREAPRTLDNFLQGDDVLTGREVEDQFQSPADEVAEAHGGDVDLEAELEKYLLREQERERLGGNGPASDSPGTRAQGFEAVSHLGTAGPEAPESKWSKEDWPPDDDWPATRQAT